MSGLAGKVAIVTGGGRGIGRAHSLHLAEQGAKVVVCDLGVALDGSGMDKSVADAVSAEIRKSGGTSQPVAADISTFEGGAAVVEAAIHAFDRVDIIVNNAGIAGGALSTRSTRRPSPRYSL